MQRLFIAIFALSLVLGLCIPAFAEEYEFSSGAEASAVFGKSTSYDELISSNPITENVRRNKDAAYYPPPYGVFSGDIPTDPSSLYHDNSRSGGSKGATASYYNGDSYSYGGGTSFSSSYPSNTSVTDIASGLLPTTSIFGEATYYTAPLYLEDGSIGILYIPKLSKTISVYEGETLESMSKGIGHFEGTSVWDGLVGLAGHNRGAAPYFSFVKDLAIGDTLVYTTLYGARTYKVYNKEKIGEADYSGLAWSAENILSLITCIENQPTQRWLVQAKEVVPQ